MSAELKLKEVAFHIELLDALERRGKPLTHIGDVELEASFLFSAIMNGLYSAVEILRAGGIDTRQFKAAHPEVYANGGKGGERGLTVHMQHKVASSRGYIPPPHNEVNFYLRVAPVLAPDPSVHAGRVDVNLLAPVNMHIRLRNREMSALEFAQEQYGYLRRFLKSLNAPQEQ